MCSQNILAEWGRGGRGHIYIIVHNHPKLSILQSVVVRIVRAPMPMLYRLISVGFYSLLSTYFSLLLYLSGKQAGLQTKTDLLGISAINHQHKNSIKNHVNITRLLLTF